MSLRSLCFTEINFCTYHFIDVCSLKIFIEREVKVQADKHKKSDIMFCQVYIWVVGEGNH